MAFQDRVAGFCRVQRLLEPGDRVICALSGGADSVALLWSLYLMREKWELTLSAAHFNHGLRGAESDRDETFVRSLCQSLQIPLTVGRGQVTRQGRGVEDAARRARYNFLESLEPGAKIATAHTADDNGETVLLHLLRGTGLQGLGGIMPRRGRVIRPMLTMTRREVEDFLGEWNLRHVEDSSNQEQDFLRNRLRQQVMPVLLRENPQFSRNCCRMTQGLREDEDFLRCQSEAAFQTVCRGDALDCQAFLGLHPAMQSRVAAMYLRRQGVKEPEQIHIDQILALVKTDQPSARSPFPGGVCLGRQYGLLRPMPSAVGIVPTVLPIPGEIQVGAWRVLCRTGESVPEPTNKRYCFALAAERLPSYPLMVRSRHAEDVLVFSGGHRRVKRLMIDQKIPAALRDALPVIGAGPHVLAVAGLGVNLDFAAECGECTLTIQIFPIDSSVVMPGMENPTLPDM